MGFLEQYDAADDPAKVDLVNGWIGSDGKEFFAELRRERPILVTPGPVVVTRYADVQEVLSRHKVFTVQAYGPKMDPCVGPFMLARDATTINERDKSIMTAMLRSEDLNLEAIRRIYGRNPASVEKLMRQNESFVFFREADGIRGGPCRLGFAG